MKAKIKAKASGSGTVFRKGRGGKNFVPQLAGWAQSDRMQRET